MYDDDVPQDSAAVYKAVWDAIFTALACFSGIVVASVFLLAVVL